MCSTDLLVVVRTGDHTLIGKLPPSTPGPFAERLLYRSDRAAHWRRDRKQVTACRRNVRPELARDGLELTKSISKH